MVQQLVRGLLFKRVLRKGAFPRAKTNKAMNPASGPRLPPKAECASRRRTTNSCAACRRLASRDERMRTTVFGVVPVANYVRFMELHTRHHGKQMAEPR
jgi:hypothetical protein